MSSREVFLKNCQKLTPCILMEKNPTLGPPRIEPMIGRVRFRFFPGLILDGHYAEKSESRWPLRFGPDICILKFFLPPSYLYIYTSKGVLADSKQCNNISFKKM